MLTDIVDSIARVIGTVENDLVVFTKMVIIPMFFLLRGVAVVGMIYPLVLCVNHIFTTTDDIGETVVLAFCWVLGNTMILLSPLLTSDWKWIWVDIVGLSIGTIVIVNFIRQAKTTNYYEKYNKRYNKNYNKNHH